MYKKTVVTRYDTRELVPFVRQDALESMLSLVASCIQGLFERSLRFALIIPGYGKTEGAVCRPGSGEGALLACMEALAAVDYRGQETRLPAQELRALRRELGVVQLCAYSDAPVLAAPLAALGLERHRVIACRRSPGSAAGESPVTLLSDWSPELTFTDAGHSRDAAPDSPKAPAAPTAPAAPASDPKGGAA